MKNLILSFLVLGSLHANAYNRPTRIEVLSLPLPSAEATPQQKNEIYKNLNSAILQVANGQIELPEVLGVYMPSKFSNAFYFGLGQTLVTPFQLSFNGQSKHPKFTRGVELHEFGHSIFEANRLSLLVNRRADFESVMLALRHKPKYRNVGSKYVAYMVVAELVKGTRDEAAVNQEFEKVQLEFGTLMSSNEQVMKASMEVDGRFKALNEFFADVFAVVLTRDPDVIKNALQFSSHIAGNHSDRSFRIRAGKRTYSVEPHNLYTLSRYHLYKYYLSHPEVRRMGSTWILKRTLESVRCSYENLEMLQKDIIQNIEKINPAHQERYVVEKFNESLNSCIDQVFNK